MARARTVGRYIAAPGKWCSTLLLLMAESFGERYKRTRLASALAIAEPLAIIGLFAALHSLMSARPPFGTSFLLFYATGILPYYVFIHVSLRMRAWDSLRRIPRTTDFDLALAHVLDEVLVKLIIMVICYGGLWLYGVRDALPADPLQCLVAVLAIALMGVGVGLLNAVISSFFVLWLYIYGIAIRGWMAFSGVWFVVDMMPPQLREIVVYNPISHVITLYRDGHYIGYPTLTLDREYLAIGAVAMFAIGWAALSSTGQWRSAR